MNEPVDPSASNQPDGTTDGTVTNKILKLFLLDRIVHHFKANTRFTSEVFFIRSFMVILTVCFPRWSGSVD